MFSHVVSLRNRIGSGKIDRISGLNMINQN
jgi:hypothetical protein